MCCFRVRDHHPLWLHFPAHSANKTFCNFSLPLPTKLYSPTTPHLSKIDAVWAIPLSLSATEGMLLQATCFPFLWVLRCFTSPSMLCVVFTTIQYSYLEWVSPFGNLRFIGCVSPRRRLSQTSRVLHRHLHPRHPPNALNFLS